MTCRLANAHCLSLSHNATTEIGVIIVITGIISHLIVWFPLLILSGLFALSISGVTLGGDRGTIVISQRWLHARREQRGCLDSRPSSQVCCCKLKEK